MAKGSDYRIKKIEKGPLQRFKNQNLLIKKFGETGLQVYKAITGKRTTHELRQDMGIEQDMFDQILTYMQDAGMVELEPTTAKSSERASKETEAPAEEEEAPAEEETPAEEEKPGRTLEEIPPEEEIGPEEETPPLEEKPQEKEGAPEEEEASAEEEAPAEEEEEPAKAKKPAPEKKKELPAWGDEEEIRPIMEGEDAPPEEEKPEEKEEEESPAEEGEGEGEQEKEEAPAEGGAPAEEEKPAEEELEMSGLEAEGRKYDEETELSPVEKIISDRYGDIGLRVYALIDGQRTAEEIMKETGLTEPKLVEILDFMDEQGIIKLDYPKGGAQPPPASGFAGPRAAQSPPAAQAKESESFGPMTDSDESLDEARAVPSPVEIPIKAPMDIVKSVQMKARIMLKFGDKGSKVFEMSNGKSDVIDISLKLDLPLFEVTSLLLFMMENGMVIMKQISRSDVRKKYGDDGYSVYKRYGKEGLMLYELIGKEMTIKQMADRITTDKSKIIDMFIFIHKVLGIDLPIDRDVLSKQLGI